MYGFSGRQWMASISSSRRAVSRASAVPLARAEIALPFNLLAGLCRGSAAGVLAFFFVAIGGLSPRSACDKMTVVCLASIHRTGKGDGASEPLRAVEISQSL